MVASLVAQTVKNLPLVQETRVWSLGQEDPWRRECQPTPVFLPGEFYGQGSLAGYSPWGCRVRHDWVTNIRTHSKRVTLLQAKWYYHLNFQMRNLKLSEVKWLCTKPDSKSRAAPEWKPRSPDPLLCSQHQFVSSSSLRKPVPSLEYKPSSLHMWRRK